MFKQIFILLVFAIGLQSCGSDTQKQTAETNNSEAATALQYFGDKISADQPISYEELLTQMGAADSVNVKVSGRVSSVCQKKGCWMNIVSDQEGQPEMFVKFKDYGFFMPLDIAGRKVVMQGHAFRSITSVDELRHYAEDEGKSKEEIEAIIQPEEQLSFMASGVVLLPEES